MTYTEYKDHLKVCEVLGKEPAGKFKSIQDFLTVLWDGTVPVPVPGSDDIALYKGQEWYFTFERHTGHLWCHNLRVWLFFEMSLGMGIIKTRNFIRDAVGNHLKCDVGTPHITHTERRRDNGRRPGPGDMAGLRGPGTPP